LPSVQPTQRPSHAPCIRSASDASSPAHGATLRGGLTGQRGQDGRLLGLLVRPVRAPGRRLERREQRLQLREIGTRVERRGDGRAVCLDVVPGLGPLAQLVGQQVADVEDVVHEPDGGRSAQRAQVTGDRGSTSSAAPVSRHSRAIHPSKPISRSAANRSGEVDVARSGLVAVRVGQVHVVEEAAVRADGAEGSGSSMFMWKRSPMTLTAGEPSARQNAAACSTRFQM
jgi:hypothetical protein